jgi:four helix bundle suffix protein
MGDAMRKDRKNRKDASEGNNAGPERLLPPRGDYSTLLAFQKAEIVYDITFRFGHKFLAKGDRTVDQMIQSAPYVRQLGRKKPQTYELYRQFVETRSPETVANIAIGLIHQANYLIDQQLRRLDQDFREQGGLRERMSRIRRQQWNHLRQ